MRVLFTGGSSLAGERLLRRLLTLENYNEVWCARHRRQVSVSSPKLRMIKVDLEQNINLSPMPFPVDLVVHCAGLTHARDKQRYRSVNLEGTMRLAARSRELGCRRFVFISTRCATQEGGAYGESKLAAEVELRKLTWQSLLIIRPAEIYGGGGTEGIDGLIGMAEKWHLVPLLWGDERLFLAPLHLDDFALCSAALIAGHRHSVKTVDLCGPESLSCVSIALRIARRCRALPVPLWWPGLVLALKLLQRSGFSPVAPDQVSRLVGQKTATRSSDDPALNSPMLRFLDNLV
jgi:nucleoside-diphosphate-sugar epimerase